MRSYDELEQQYTPMLYDIAHRFGSTLDVDDAVQELRLTRWRAQQLWRENGGASFTTYLYRACVNQCRKLHYREFGRKSVVPANLRASLTDSQGLAIDIPVNDDSSLLELVGHASLPARTLAVCIMQGVPEQSWGKSTSLAKDEINEATRELRELLVWQKEDNDEQRFYDHTRGRLYGGGAPEEPGA